MKDTQNWEIRDRGFLFSGANVYYLGIAYIVLMFLMMLILTPVMQYFPELAGIEWLTDIPLIITGGVFLLYVFGLFYTVTLKEDSVILKWMGIPVRRISVSGFRMFCAVGNGRENVLCLSPYSTDEMAAKQEKRLMRSFFHKHAVLRQKQKSGWQDGFSRQYLNHLRKNPFGRIKERNVIMFRMHPSSQYAMRKMYPQLPYMNYTGVTGDKKLRNSGFSENQAVCLRSKFQEYEVHMESGGIHVRNIHEEISFIPAEQIKTAVRLDVFSEYRKFYPHHIPLLYITSLSEEELAEHSLSRGKGVFRVDIPFEQAHMAMTAASCLAQRWTGNDKNACALYHTDENLKIIQTLYKHVHINDISGGWLKSTDEENGKDNI